MAPPWQVCPSCRITVHSNMAAVPQLLYSWSPESPLPSPPASTTCYVIIHGPMVLPLGPNHAGHHFQSKPHTIPLPWTPALLCMAASLMSKESWETPPSALLHLGASPSQGFLLQLWHPARSEEPRDNQHVPAEGLTDQHHGEVPLVISKCTALDEAPINKPLSCPT